LSYKIHAIDVVISVALDFFDYLKIMIKLHHEGKSSPICRICGTADNLRLSIAPVSLAIIPLQSNQAKIDGFSSPWYLDYL
jgi:hypothetical protein